MPIHHLLRYSLEHNSGLPRDADWITVALATVADVALDPIDMKTAIESFYNGDNAPGGPIRTISDYITLTVSREANVHNIEIYDVTGHLDGSPHGSPYAVGKWTLTGVDDTTMRPAPAEMQVVLTLEAEGRATAPVELPPLPGEDKVRRPKQQHTGRWYIGPVDGKVLGLKAGEYRYGHELLTDLCVAAGRFRNLMLDDFGAFWCVWSRRGQVMRHVESVFVDDAPDTQRRRGVDPSELVRNSVLAD